MTSQEILPTVQGGPSFLGSNSSFARRIFRKFLVKPFLLANQALWKYLPAGWARTRIGHAHGSFVHALVRSFSERTQFYGTYFLRNRPEMDLLARLASEKSSGNRIRIAVLGCSNGAEVYSIAWTIRSRNPQLDVTMTAADISGEILEIAEAGSYSVENRELMDAAIFERLSMEEMRDMFNGPENGRVRIKPWIRKGIEFQLADASDPGLRDRIGTYPIVVANRFLCHMPSALAETCLRNLSHLVEPGGYLFVSGVDLEIRMRVARDLQWAPLQEGLEEVHDGDPSVRRDWPWRWWGLEPFTKHVADWEVRYASVFRIGVED